MTRPAKTHDLKTHPAPFQDVWDGLKTFEFRKNDRDYQLWDTLILREYYPDTNRFTGRAVKVYISHLIAGPSEFGIPDGYVCMSIQDDGASVDGEHFTAAR